MKLYHYAKKPVTFNRFHIYLHKRFDKPTGLWVSVPGSGPDWPEWCRSEDYATEWLEVEHEVTLKPNARILYLNTVAGIANLARLYPNPASPLSEGSPDWDAIARDYQGIIIPTYQWECRHDVAWYYGWDCGSGCIWDLAAIEAVTPTREQVAA